MMVLPYCMFVAITVWLVLELLEVELLVEVPFDELFAGGVVEPVWSSRKN